MLSIVIIIVGDSYRALSQLAMNPLKPLLKQCASLKNTFAPSHQTTARHILTALAR